MEEMELIMSEKGKTLIVIEGFKFYFQKVLKNDLQRWSCVKKSCKAFIKLNKLQNIVEKSAVHNHKCDKEISRNHKFSNVLKRKINIDPPDPLDVSSFKFSRTELLPKTEVDIFTPGHVICVKNTYNNPKIKSKLKMVQQVIVGPLIHSSINGELIILDDAAVIVEDGIISSILTNPKIEDLKMKPITILKKGQFLIPGFVDCHFHAVQFPNIGLGYDSPLLDWLEKYTFPLEKKFSDNEFADKIFDAVVQRTLDLGTTTICYFASLYRQACSILAKKAIKYGQRAFIGKLNMNFPRDDGYCESTEDSINDTLKFISDLENLKSPLVKPILTPRFALSCDMDLMKKLGKLAKDKDLPIQTHISENLEEIEAVNQIFKEYSSYAEVYKAAGLLTKKTVLAHGVHLTNQELDIIKNEDSSIIHCPSSNACLKSGICDVQRLRAKGIKIGLGTDVGGGQSPSILDAMKTALTTTNYLCCTSPKYQALDYKDVFYLATLGGATCLSLDDKIGNFEVGKQFDALVIDLNSSKSCLDNLINYSLLESLQRFIYSGDDRNIAEVFVCGRKVK